MKHEATSRLPGILFPLLPVYFLSSLILSAQGLVEVQLQHSDAPAGPWRPQSIGPAQLKNGNILMQASGQSGFYRLALLGPSHRDPREDANGAGTASEDPFSAPGNEKNIGDPFAKIPREQLRERALFPDILSEMPDRSEEHTSELQSQD